MKLRQDGRVFPSVPLPKRRKKQSDPLDVEGWRETARRTDSNPQLVAAARFLRGLLPGDDGLTGERSKGKVAPAVDRLLTEADPKRPSTVHELGMGVLQTWQALSEAQRRGRGKADVAILFTDLVGFSDWALEAGDEAALELLNQVGDAEQKAVSENQGAVVKRLGDGAMAVFSHAEQAVSAALGAQKSLGGLKVAGHRPKLRAGVHQGRPRKVRGDFLGVDVNIAARVGDAAKAGEVLISQSARETLDPAAFRFGSSRQLSAPGAPADLTVCSVKPRRVKAAQ
jgi:adenylate cyclase